MLEVNSKAINFVLPDEKGELHELKDYFGKKIILYFYPKDNTSGCTTQAILYKELYEEIKNNNGVVIGISKDSEKSHQKFIDKYDLPFVLLADTSLDVIKAYDVWHEKKLYGKSYMGVVRTTYVIDEKGIIVSAKANVNPKEDAINSLCTIKSYK